MVKAAEERGSQDGSSRLRGATDRGVLLERQMGTGAIVIVSVGPEGLAKMRLAQDYDVVEAFASDRADEPFDVSVLLGRAGCVGRSWMPIARTLFLTIAP
jgi:hypothetical protein